MEKYFITFRSVTYAQKGERALKSQGISCFLQRTPRWMEARGCGYAVTLKEYEAAVRALEDRNIRWEKIYRQRDHEQPEVVQL